LQHGLEEDRDDIDEAVSLVLSKSDGMDERSVVAESQMPDFSEVYMVRAVQSMLFLVVRLGAHPWVYEEQLGFKVASNS
jgi:hypothetical protein